MSNPERITSPYAPDLGEVREFLERMVKAMRFVELIRAVLSFVMRVCEAPSANVTETSALRETTVGGA